jgi:hypothetical protein
MTENVPQGGARLSVDEETGKPFWSLWGADWMDGMDMNPGDPVRLNPGAFPTGTVVLIHEPDMDSEAAREFYARVGLTSVGRLPDAPPGPVVEATRQQWELMLLRLVRRLPRDDPHRKRAEEFLHVHGTGPLGALRADHPTQESP